MKNLIAFADESGNNSFEFDTQGSHFIVASIILSEKDIEETRQKLELIRKKHFQTGEIKSSKVANNHRRRIEILEDLKTLDYSIYAVAVDKRKLFGEGFKYKGSFYKFLNGLVYKELFKTFPDLKLQVDEHGSNDFMRQFKKYVQLNHITDLFSNSTFSFISSNDNSLIQLADFIAGTLGRCFDETKKSSFSNKFLELLNSKLISINYFPEERYSYNYLASESDVLYDPLIADIALNSARQFINEKKVEKQEDIDQVNCVKLLLLYFNYYSSKRYISTKELMRHLQVGRIEELKEHFFRTKIIGRLRDKGVLIASSTSGEKKGYKLPSSKEDLNKFVNHGKSVIVPMLSRIKKFRDIIKLASNNQIDVLNLPEYEVLKTFIEK